MASEARRKILQDIASTVETIAVAPQEVLAVESWNRLSKAVNTQSSLDETTLDDLEAISQHYERMRPVLTSHDLLAGGSWPSWDYCSPFGISACYLAASSPMLYCYDEQSHDWVDII
jgi:hypothetical protein